MTESDIFLSYKHDDRDRVAPLHAALTAEGVSVWWDHDIPGGERWRETIATKLDGARCVIVVWSTTSTSPEGEFVRDEAARAKARGVLLPVRIDPVDPPLGFGELQALDLMGWRADRSDPRFADVLAAVRAQIAGRPRPEPHWPALRRRRRILAWAVGLPMLALTTVLLSADARRASCMLPGVHSVCGQLGIGGVPSEAEQEQWLAAVDPPTPEGLRGYLEHYPRGAHADEAQSRLAACRFREEATWHDETKPLPMAVRSSRLPHETEHSARADARSRADAEATHTCQPWSEGPFRLLSTSFEVTQWLCTARDDGWRCGFDGRALCEVQARKTYRREICGDT